MCFESEEFLPTTLELTKVSFLFTYSGTVDLQSFTHGTLEILLRKTNKKNSVQMEQNSY